MTLRTPAFNDAKTYGFEWLRYLAELASLQEGVVGSGDFKVTAAAGGGMKVDVAAGACFTKGDSGVAAVGLSQGLFLSVNDASIANAVTLSASDGSNPRIDQICLRVRDSSDLATGADDATLLVVTGVATSGATLDNRTGAAALPSDHLRLADVLVPAGSTATSAGNIRDRRPWARGAAFEVNLTTPTTFLTTSSTTMQEIHSSFSQRLELSGVALRWVLRVMSSQAGGFGVDVGPWIDAGSASVANGGGKALYNVGPTGLISLDAFHTIRGLTAASHLISAGGNSGSGGTNATFQCDANRDASLIVFEDLRPNATNT